MQGHRMFRARRTWGAALLLALLWSLVASAEMPQGSTADDDRIAELAPFIVQIVNFAALDPVLAASLVPEDWIESMVGGAAQVEAEVARKPSKIDPPIAWPIGPWTTPESLAATIKAAQPGAVGSLYRALKPRITTSCRKRKSSWANCDRAIRTSVAKLSAAAVLARSIGSTPVVAVTPTQRELARLGPPVVVAVRDQFRVLGKTVWGEAWNTRP